MIQAKTLLIPSAVLLLSTASGPPSNAHQRAVLKPVAPNDNRVAAGTMKGGVLEISLDTREGAWHPVGPDRPAVATLAFGEKGKPLQMPGPMIRVKAGTRVHARVTNSATTTLVVHGLAARHVVAMDTLVVPAGETRDASFTADEAGTFFYWGSTTGASFEDRILEDSRLSGALVVDPAGAAPRPDRVFMVQWYIPGKDTSGAPDFNNSFFTFNGLPWPQSERLAYSQGDSVPGASSTPRPTSIRCTCTASTSASPRAAICSATRCTGRRRSGWV